MRSVRISVGSGTVYCWVVLAAVGLFAAVGQATNPYVGLLVGMIVSTVGGWKLAAIDARAAVREASPGERDGNAMRALGEAHRRAAAATTARDGDHIPLSDRAVEAWTAPDATRDQLLAYLHSRTLDDLRDAVRALEPAVQLPDPDPEQEAEEEAEAALDAYQKHVTSKAAARMDPDKWIAREVELRAALVEAGTVADIRRSKSLGQAFRIATGEEGRNAR